MTKKTNNSKKINMFERIKDFFSKHPQLFGIIFCLSGILMLVAAIKNWEWLLGGSSWNLQKIEGISNFFGRTIARIVAGVFGGIVIIAGIVWFIIYAFYYKR